MGTVFYYLLTFAESVTSVFGLRFPYEQPRYAVLQTLQDGVEIRQYQPRLAIEATLDPRQTPNAPNQAFQLLFNYITGDNGGQQKIAMTVPVGVENRTEKITMTAPVQSESGPDRFTMRFFLPDAVARAGAPAPHDPRLHLVHIPAETIAALCYSGIPTQDARREHTNILRSALAKSGWTPTGEVFALNYDPPFTIPFLRRNEVAFPVSRTPTY